MSQAAEEQEECAGHPAGPHDPIGQTVYCDGSCRPGARVPAVVSAIEAALTKAPRAELECFTRTLLIAIRTGEPVTMEVRQAEGVPPREFIVIATELLGEAKEASHGGGKPEEKLKELIRTLEEGGRLAAELGDLLRDAPAVGFTSFSIELFNCATELREVVKEVSAHG